jgi:hypothetical protein
LPPRSRRDDRELSIEEEVVVVAAKPTSAALDVLRYHSWTPYPSIDYEYSSSILDEASISSRYWIDCRRDRPSFRTDSYPNFAASTSGK